MTSGAEKERTAATAGLADALVFAAVFALYAAAASPALGWLDSPELVAASVGLGVPHSPGHPLPVFLGAAATLVPLGDLALRVNLAAAAAGAAVCALLAAAGRAVFARAAPELSSSVRTWLAAATALVVGGSWALWMQSVRAEVYALAAALLVAALGAVLAWDGDRRPRWLVAAGLAGGLALATHHLMAVLLLVPAGVFVIARRERPAASLAGATALAGVVGLAAFLYLPVRSAAGPELDWGAPSAAGRFVWTVSGAMFAGTATAEQVSPIGEDAAQSLWAVGEAAGAPIALLAVLGAIVLFSRRRGVAALLVAVAAASIAGRALFGFDPETPDHHGYLLPAVAAVALLGLFGAAALARRRVAPILIIAGLGFALARAALGWPDAALRGAHASDDLARRELETLPPRALLVTSYFETSYRALALRAVEETRPDVDILHRGMLTLPGAREAAEKRHPALAALIRAPLAAGRPTPVAELAAVAAARPIAFELDPDLDPPASAQLVSAGRFARFVVAPPDRSRAEAADGRARLALSALMSHTGGSDRDGARRALLWLDFSRLVHYCTLGRRAAAQEALLRAWDLSPGDVILEEHAARCGLQTPRTQP